VCNIGCFSKNKYDDWYLLQWRWINPGMQKVLNHYGFIFWKKYKMYISKKKDIDFKELIRRLNNL